jgi:hypothetical protein
MIKKLGNICTKPPIIPSIPSKERHSKARQALDNTARTMCTGQDRLIEKQATLRGTLERNIHSLRFMNKEQSGITIHPRDIGKEFVESVRSSSTYSI